MKQLSVIYSQQDPRWGSQRLGTVNGITISGYGCYVTSMAMLACYFGHVVTPAQLDDIMTNNNWYVQGDLMQDNNLQKAFSDIVYQQSIDYSNSPADLGKLQTLNNDPSTMVILEVDFNPSLAGVQTHFVVCVDCDGTNVQIADPWTGTVCNINKYGDPKTTIQKFVVYKGTPSTGLMYKGYDLGNPDSMKVAVDVLVRLQNGEFVDKSKYDADLATVNQKLNDANTNIGNLTATINKNNDTIKVLTNNNADLTQKVSDLTKANNTLTDANKTLSNQVAVAQVNANTDQRTIDELKAKLAALPPSTTPTPNPTTPVVDYKKGFSDIKTIASKTHWFYGGDFKSILTVCSKYL